MSSPTPPLLSVHDLRVVFDTEAGPVAAVDGVRFELEEGCTLGLVGESGSGKSLTSLALLGLVPAPGKIVAGRIVFRGVDLRTLEEKALRERRGGEIAMVFQDPMTSLNPFLTIGEQLGEVVALKDGATRREAFAASASALGDVGIPAPERILRAHPHELSGGMRQRVMIAMALLGRPKVLIADEPTTALDVTIQAQILELLRDLQEENGMSILLITHDLGVAAEMCSRLSVMYAGRIVESGKARSLFQTPAHPYTRGLIDVVPRLDHDPARRLAQIDGQPPRLGHSSPGCAFAPRCPVRIARCTQERPELAPHDSERNAACFAPLSPSQEA